MQNHNFCNTFVGIPLSKCISNNFSNSCVTITPQFDITDCLELHRHHHSLSKGKFKAGYQKTVKQKGTGFRVQRATKLKQTRSCSSLLYHCTSYISYLFHTVLALFITHTLFNPEQALLLFLFHDQFQEKKNFKFNRTILHILTHQIF